MMTGGTPISGNLHIVKLMILHDPFVITYVPWSIVALDPHISPRSFHYIHYFPMSYLGYGSVIKLAK